MMEYTMGDAALAITLDKRQARLLSFLLQSEIVFMVEGDDLGVEGAERAALDDIKERIDVALGFEDIPPPRRFLAPDTICVTCQQPLEKHFPLPPEGCDGFRIEAS